MHVFGNVAPLCFRLKEHAMSFTYSLYSKSALLLNLVKERSWFTQWKGEIDKFIKDHEANELVALKPLSSSLLLLERCDLCNCLNRFSLSSQNDALCLFCNLHFKF